MVLSNTVSADGLSVLNPSFNDLCVILSELMNLQQCVSISISLTHLYPSHLLPFFSLNPGSLQRLPTRGHTPGHGVRYTAAGARGSVTHSAHSLGDTHSRTATHTRGLIQRHKDYPHPHAHTVAPFYGVTQGQIFKVCHAVTSLHEVPR